MKRHLVPALLLAAFLCIPAEAEDFSLFLTSNLEGKFSLQDGQDPTLYVIQNLYRKKAEGKPVLYFDLGNTFFPGILSRYSFGAVMYDFLDMNGCDATLVSSRDMRMGLDNLLLLGSGRSQILISANILRDRKPVFQPWTIKQAGRKKIAVVGLSGYGVTFDITDKMTSDVTIETGAKMLEPVLNEISLSEKPDAVILMSGLTSGQNLRIMSRFPSLSLCVSGGDSRGQVYYQTASQITLPDGRKILMTDSRKGYFTAECSLTDSFSVSSFKFHEAETYAVRDERYKRFESRLSLWRSRYLDEKKDLFGIPEDQTIHVTDTTAAQIMREKIKTEISIITPSTVTPFDLTSSSTPADIERNTYDDFYLYRFKLKGSDIAALADDDAFAVFGYDDGKIQGYPIRKSRLYTVTATQSVYEKILDSTEADYLSFENTWKTVPDILSSDIRGKRHSALDDFSYLDDRIGCIARIKLSNSLNNESIENKNSVTPPGGMSSSSHQMLTMEDSADLILYNRTHMLTISPYIYYIRDEAAGSRSLLSNILRQVFVYQLNTNETYTPYVKSQYETTISRVNRQRPALTRNTIGLNITTDRLTAKTGAGFSKQVKGPSQALLAGVEANGVFSYPVTSAVTYKFALDSFLSRAVGPEYYSLNAKFSNGISYSMTDTLSVSLTHRYTYYHDGSVGHSYTNNALLISFDIGTSFNLF